MQLLNDILNTLVPKLDHARVVDIMERFDCVALVKGYLQGVQKVLPRSIVRTHSAVSTRGVPDEPFSTRGPMTTHIPPIFIRELP